MSADDPETEDRALAFAEAIDERLEEDPEAALTLARTAPPELALHPDVRLVTAAAVAEVEGEENARTLLEALVEDHPDDADARHALGCVHEALGEHVSSVEQFLEVLQLDAEADQLVGFDSGAAASEIVGLARGVLDGLPASFRDRLASVPVVVEPRPARDLVEQGFDPRSVGLFEGSDHTERLWDSAPALPRIVLYSANLTASLDPDDPDALAREVEITVLHEVGHFFGLDEERLEELGLG